MRTNVPGGLRVVGVRGDGTRVAEARLGHGEHPDVVLGAAGWLVEDPVFATVVDDGALEVGYRVRELDGKLDFEVEGGLDFALLRELVPALDDARGRVDLRLSLTGTQKEPIAVGNAVLAGIGLRPKGLPVELTEGQGTVTFSPEAVVIDGINAKINGGPVLLSGQLELDHFTPQRLEVRAEIGEIPLRFDDVERALGRTTAPGGDRDLVALGDEGLGDRAADAAVAAGHEDDTGLTLGRLCLGRTHPSDAIDYP